MFKSSDNHRRYLLAFAVVILLCVYFFALKNSAMKIENSYQHETISFDTYWAACQLYKTGANPYDQTALAEKMSSANLVWNPALNYYNPPWLLPLICQFTDSSPDFSFNHYRNGCLIAILAAFGFWGLRSKTPFKSIAILLACNAVNYPLWIAFSEGQSAGLVAVLQNWLIATFYAGKTFYSGLLFASLSIKPHVSIIFGIFLFILAIRLKLKLFLVSSFLFLFTILLHSWTYHPDLLRDWISVMFGQSSLAPKPMWLGSMLTGWLMAQSDTRLGTEVITNSAIPYAVMSSGIVIAIYAALRVPQLNLKKVLPFMLMFSSFMAPYGYIYDHTSGSIGIYFLINQTESWKAKLALFSAWTVFNMILYYSMHGLSMYYHELTWFPFAILCLFAFSFFCLNKSKQESLS